MTAASAVYIHRPSFWKRLGALCARRETIRYLVSSNLKAGHRHKVLGNLWNLLDPLLSLGVYYLVFGVWINIGHGDPGSYLTYLFVGILAWRFLDGVISQAVACVRGNRGLIQEISFPKAVFPISICFSRLYDFLWGFVVLLAVLFALGRVPTLHALWIPLVMVIQLVLMAGLALLVAYLGAFFADTANIVHVIIRLGFYASPILYYATGEQSVRVPAKYLKLYMLNPVACLLEGYRCGLTEPYGPPDWPHIAYAAGFAVATLIVGYVVFSRGEGKFAKYV